MDTVDQLLLQYISHPSHYQKKDINKFKDCTKLIARGSGSTGLYARVCAHICNKGSYKASDRVAVSVNGNRPDRKDVNYLELDRALEANATIVTDTLSDRSRPYNVGERNLAEYLTNNNYSDSKGVGIWKKNPNTDSI